MELQMKDCVGMSRPRKSSLNVEHESFSDSSSHCTNWDYLCNEINVNSSLTIDSDTCRSRKRKRNPEQWQRSIMKTFKNSCKSFISQWGKVIKQGIIKKVVASHTGLSARKNSLKRRERTFFIGFGP